MMAPNQSSQSILKQAADAARAQAERLTDEIDRQLDRIHRIQEDRDALLADATRFDADAALLHPDAAQPDEDAPGAMNTASVTISVTSDLPGLADILKAALSRVPPADWDNRKSA